METFELKDQEVFAAGTWNGDTYDVSDLDKMIEAYAATQDTFKPKIKLTHDHPKGWPSVGWMENLRRVGKKIVADFKGIPKKVFDLMQSGGYSGKSAEILWNPVVKEKKWPYLMQAVALLGVDMPAVDSISQIMGQLYTSDNDEAKSYQSEAPEGALKMYDIDTKQKEQSMNELEQAKKDLADANAKLVEAQGEVAKYSKENADLKKASEDALKAKTDAENRANSAEEKIKEFSAKEVERKVTSTVDKLIEDKKLSPANKEKAYALIRAVVESGTEKKYKLGEKESSLEEIAVDLLGSGGVDLSDSTKTYAGTRKTGKENEGVINEDLAKSAKEYHAKHPEKSYADCLREVAREEVA